MLEKVSLADSFEVDIEGSGLLLGTPLAADVKFPGLIRVLYLIERSFCGFLHRYLY